MGGTVFVWAYWGSVCVGGWVGVKHIIQSHSDVPVDIFNLNSTHIHLLIIL